MGCYGHRIRACGECLSDRTQRNGLIFDVVAMAHGHGHAYGHGAGC